MRTDLWVKKLFFLLICSFCLFPLSTHADFDELNLPPENEFFRARVIEIIKTEGEDRAPTYQQFKAQPLEGSLDGQEIVVTQEAIHGVYNIKKIKLNETLVIYRDTLSNPEFLVHDKYRLPPLLFLFFLFLACVVGFTGKKGIRATLSLAGSLFIIIFFVVPQIAHGANPIFISLLSALLLLLLSIYVGHGINKRTSIALVGSLSVIGLSVILGEIFIRAGKLFGLGSNEAVLLQFGNLGTINLRGLLLAGIIIGTIGILDDVTVVQAATVEEIHNTDTTIERKELYKKGMSIGKEHILSMVNTLVIAYTGAALPLLLFFTYQQNLPMPLWVKINGEQLSEEIVRSLIGSIVLIFAVPLTTWLAAYSYTKTYAKRNEDV